MVSFSNVDEVEYVFDVSLTAMQSEMIETYIKTGVRPQPGCMFCDSGEMRILTGKMDAYLIAVENGEEKWPWPDPVKQIDVPVTAGAGGPQIGTAEIEGDVATITITDERAKKRLDDSKVKDVSVFNPFVDAPIVK